MKRRSCRLIVIGGLFLPAIVAISGPATKASAAIYQCGVYGSRWTGWTSRDAPRRPSTGIEGASADLWANYDTSVCSTDDSGGHNFTFSYDMVYDSTSKYWSQAGNYFGYGDPCVFATTEQAVNGVSTRLYFYCTNSGEEDAYRNLLVGNPYRMAASINGETKQQTTYNPIGTWGYPFDIQFMGETKYLQSDVPGVSTNKQLFTSMGVQQYTTDDLVSTCGNVILAHYGDIPGRYATDSVSCNYVRTWTVDGQ